MAIATKLSILVLGLLLLTMVGCASYSQTFMGPEGDIKHCASTSQAQGLAGVFMAGSRFDRCVDEIRVYGYQEIETVGTIGVALYSADVDGLKIRKVYDNSPAAKAGILRGDSIVAINGKKVAQNCGFAETQGAIGSFTDITVVRDGKEMKHSLKRAGCTYSRVLEDIVY
jgi:membrane-associated protease RseP (regulator of RpoE activity)